MIANVLKIIFKILIPKSVSNVRLIALIALYMVLLFIADKTIKLYHIVKTMIIFGGNIVYNPNQ